MRFFIYLLIVALLPLQVLGKDTAQFSKFSFNRNSPRLELENDRTYYLVGSTVIEEFREETLPFKYNVFDFDNGIIIHSFDDSIGCENIVTSFSSLPRGREDEVRNIGCRIFQSQKRLLERGDELDYFNRKFCGQNPQ